MNRRSLVVGLALAGAVIGPVAASAAWQPTGAAPGTVAVGSAGTGTTPAVSVSGSTVTASWTASTVAAGVPATSYTVAYYAASSGGTAEGTAACPATSCTVSGVPSGDHWFGVTPVYRNWVGTEGTRTKATVAALAIKSMTGNNGNAMISFSGVGGVPNTTVMVTVCSSAPCAGAAAATLTAPVAADGSWTSTSTGSTGPLNTTSNYYAMATDGSLTSATVGPFQAGHGSKSF